MKMRISEMASDSDKSSARILHAAGLVSNMTVNNEGVGSNSD